MKSNRWVAIALAAGLVTGALCLSGCGSRDGEADSGSGSELSGAINVEGSDTIVNMGQAWAEVFMTANPGVMISVKGGGSGTGIAALINGTVGFAAASREMKEEEIALAREAGVDPVENEVAKDGISVIVNPANPVKGITVEQLGAIYRGEVTNWSELGGADKRIVLLSRDSSSGTYEFFKDAVVGKEAEYAKEARLLASNQAIVDEVKGNDAAIGYVGLGYAESAASDVVELAVEDVMPGVATVLDGSYPLARGLYLYSNGEPSGVMKAYLEWILGAEGREIVEDQGFVPVD